MIAENKRSDNQRFERKYGCKDQESIQSSTTPEVVQVTFSALLKFEFKFKLQQLVQNEWKIWCLEYSACANDIKVENGALICFLQ